MAESRQHRVLVLRVVRAVCAATEHDQISELLADCPGAPYGALPTIYGHRPDFYARASGLTIVGEAKPPWDIESARTEQQLAAFTKYVEMDCSRHLILSVNWVSAATANAVVRSVAQDWPKLKQRVHILDGRRPLTLPVKQKRHAMD